MNTYAFEKSDVIWHYYAYEHPVCYTYPQESVQDFITMLCKLCITFIFSIYHRGLSSYLHVQGIY